MPNSKANLSIRFILAVVLVSSIVACVPRTLLGVVSPTATPSLPPSATGTPTATVTSRPTPSATPTVTPKPIQFADTKDYPFVIRKYRPPMGWLTEQVSEDDMRVNATSPRGDPNGIFIGMKIWKRTGVSDGKMHALMHLMAEEEWYANGHAYLVTGNEEHCPTMLRRSVRLRLPRANTNK